MKGAGDVGVRGWNLNNGLNARVESSHLLDLICLSVSLLISIVILWQVGFLSTIIYLPNNVIQKVKERGHLEYAQVISKNLST